MAVQERSDGSASPATDVEDANPDRWWHAPFSVFQTNLQEIDALQDVEHTLDVIEEYGSDTWLINTGGIVSFYPTDLSFQTRNPFLPMRASGDLIGDAVSAAHERGIRVISRCDFSKMSARIAAEHSDWLYVSPTGEPQVYNTLYSACPSADYYQHRSLDILDEIIDRYPIDGFFFNWFGFSERDYSRVYHGVCHCRKCQDSFTAYSCGKPLPEGPESATYPEWLAFSTEVIRTLGSKISTHITDRRPDAALILGRGAPVVYHEANNAFGRELWHHATAESASAHTTGMPDIALMVNAVSFVDMPYRMASEQPEHFAQYLVQALARGGNPSTYIMGAPGRIPYANLASSESAWITQFHHRHRELYAALTPSSSVGLVRPDRLHSANEGYADTVEEFRGLYTALQERHIPFDVMAEELLPAMASSDRLQSYNMLILPDLGELGTSVATVIDEFVGHGGHVVLTGSSATSAYGASELATGPALMRVGTSSSGDQLWSTYITDTEQEDIGNYVYQRPIIPVYGSYARYVWKPGVRKQGALLPQAPFGPPEKCYGHTLSDDPDAVILPVGDGSVIQFPWTIGRTYREFGTTEVRDHFVETIEPWTGQSVHLELPEQVEAITSTAGSDLVVHLVNQTGARRRSFGPHVPVSGGRLRVRSAAKTGRAECLVSSTVIESVADAGGLAFDLPTLELFEVIRVVCAD